MPKQFLFGPLEVQVEDELLFMRMRNHQAMTLEIAKEILALAAYVSKQHGRHFILVDLAESGGIVPEARREILDQVKTSPPSAVAFYGGGIMQRAMNLLLVSAVKVLAGKSHKIAHFSTKEEARAWLIAQI